APQRRSLIPSLRRSRPAPSSRVTGFGSDHNAALVRLAITSRLAPPFGTPSSTTPFTLAVHRPRRGPHQPLEFRRELTPVGRDVSPRVVADVHGAHAALACQQLAIGELRPAGEPPHRFRRHEPVHEHT